MSKNIIFYFSGTGNSVKVAKEAANALGDCELASMGRNKSWDLAEGYDSIGFIYPVYFAGIPLKVRDFVSSLDLSGNQRAYFYAVATYGGTPGNGLSQLQDILMEKKTALTYGQTLRMVSNYVVLYDMRKNVDEVTQQSDKDIVPLLEAIKRRQVKKVGKGNPIFNWFYWRRAPKIHNADMHYNVSAACTSCGICKDACPVGNIQMDNGRPAFSHQCEQCMACIQYCPSKAINFKNKTQKRGRYTNPSIDYKEL